MYDHRVFQDENRVLRTRMLQGMMSAINSTYPGDSGSRIQMSTTQSGQAIVPFKADLPRSLTGFEDQLADCTFGIRAPANLVITAIIRKYSSGVGIHSIKSNPLATIIYRDIDTEEHGCFHIAQYQNQLERVHETFGFRYELTELGKRLHKGMSLDKGELLAKSPNINEHGLYATGLSANIAYISTPVTIEDGFGVNRLYLERARPLATGSRVAEWGRRKYPLNIMGNEFTPFKPFAEIGDKIRPDGLVFALREFDDLLYGLDVTNESLKVVDVVHDECVYGKEDAEVADITVYTTTNEGKKSHTTPDGMETLAKKYSDEFTVYYRTILEEYARIKKTGGCRLKPMLQALVVQAQGDKPNTVVRRLEEKRTPGNKNVIVKTWRANPIDEWRVEIFYTYRFPIGEGVKIGNRHGGKGVGCAVIEPEDMPVDDFGNVADLVIYSKGAIARLNPGQFYEQFINACSRDITLDIKAMVAVGNRSGAIQHMLKYYSIVGKEGYKIMSASTPEEIEELLESVLMHGIYVYLPSDDLGLGLNIYLEMMAFRPPNKSPLTYTDGAGNRVRTIESILIGEEDTIVMDKLDHKPMSISGIRRQHHGFPAVENKATKYLSASKEQPVRVLDEASVRTTQAAMEPNATAELFEITNNPERHWDVAKAIYTADNPMSIPDVFDRSKQLGGGRPISLLKHIGRCNGWEITDEPPRSR